MNEQDNFNFDSPKTSPPVDQRIVEFGKFAEEVGSTILQTLLNIAENARVILRLRMFNGQKDARQVTLEYIIRQNFFEDFKKEWPEMSGAEVSKHALECSNVVCEHLEYLQSIDPRYQMVLERRIERKEAIERGEISSKFSPCFVPPPSRSYVRADAMPEREWLEALPTKKLRGKKKLRADMEKASIAFDKRERKKTGEVLKGATREFGFIK